MRISVRNLWASLFSQLSLKVDRQTPVDPKSDLFPYLKMQMLPILHSICFGRYEIHIHDLGDFIQPICIISRSPSSQISIENEIPKFPKKTQIHLQNFKCSNIQISNFQKS